VARGDYDEPAPSQKPTGLDGFFLNTHLVLLILVAFCCALIGLPLGIAGLVACKNPAAKQNAMIMTIISGALWGISIVGNIIRFATAK
jgi:hypothetical protein